MEKLLKKINMKEVKSMALILVLVFSFRSSCFEPFRIPTGSMIPTINIGDFIVVNKFSYGVKLPFSDMFTDPVYLTHFESPKRNDVIVFKYPLDPKVNYIKRVIGLPGDEVELIKKQVFVNGALITNVPENSPVTREFADNFDGEKVNFFKVKNSDKEYVIQETNRETQADTIGRFKVPAGKYFVMGDNRDFSADSRYWGFVPTENIKGKAMVVWMSLTFPTSNEGLTMTPSRIGKVIY
jgi:signal peptidase I